jgi:hypothetical protein
MDANAIRMLRLALATLSERIMTLLSLGMTFGLACWVMASPDFMRAGMAAFFALFVFIPCIWKERTKDHERRNDQAPDGG